MHAVLAVAALLVLLTDAAAQTMSVDPADPIVIEVPINADPPTTFIVNITADRTTNWIVTGLPKWLKASITFGRTPATVTFTVMPPSTVVGASFGTTLQFTNLRTRLGDTARAVAVEVVAEEPKPSPNATWRLDGEVTPGGYADVGTTLHFSYTATNTGDAPIAAATLLPTADVDCPTADLKPGETLACGFDHMVTQGDLDAGRVIEAAELRALDSPPSALTMPLTALYAPPVVADNGSWRFENVTTPTYTGTDAELEFAFKLTNLTSQPISYSVLSQWGWFCQDQAIDPSASATCSMSHITTQEDLDNGIVQLGTVYAIVDGDWANRLQLLALAAYTPPYVLLCGDGPCLDDKGGRLIAQ